MEDIIIKIAGDSKDLVNELAKIGESGDSLSDKMKGVGVAAGVAFAGFAASIVGTVMAFREQEQAAIKVNQTILATGGIAGVTAKAVDDLAQALSNETTYQAEAVAEAEAMLLTFTRIGKQTFPDATKATADLAAGMGMDLTQAAQVVGRALQSPDNAARSLRAANIQLTAAQQAQIKSMVSQGNTAGAQAIILEELQTKYGGMAKAAAGGTGVFLQLRNAMDALAHPIGDEFAPTLIKAATWLKDLIKTATENRAFIEFAAKALAVATAVTGIITAVAGAVIVFGKLSAVFAAASAAAGAFGISLAAATGGISLLVAAGALLFTQWGTIWPAMRAIFSAFVTSIKGLAMGLGKMLIGALTADLGLLKEGWAQAKLATMQGMASVGAAIKTAWNERHLDEEKATEKHNETLMAKNKKHAQDVLNAQDALARAQHRAEVAANQATILEAQHASTLLVSLKKQEAADLKILADANFTGSKSAIRAHLKEVQALYAEAQATEHQRQTLEDRIHLREIGAHNQAVLSAEKTKLALLEKLADQNYKEHRAALLKEIQLQDQLIAREEKKELVNKRKFNKMMEITERQHHLTLNAEERAYFQKKQLQIMQSMHTEQEAQAQFLADELQTQVDAHNQLLQDQIRYGQTYAELNRIMHSAVYQGSKTAFGELEQLTQSSNSTLKSIGKAAATANIIMRTYESAMNIFAGFSTIPIIGYALGIAGAAAAVTFGFEQLSHVQGMARGGLVTGGIPGRDSVPIMGMPGELVVPQQDFADVIRSYKGRHYSGQSGGDAPSQPQKVEIVFKGEASRMLQAKDIRDKALGVFRGKG